MLKSLESLHQAPVQARDGEIGTVSRYLLDVDQWAVRYFVVHAGTWWQGREVLISPMSVAEGTLASGRIAVSLTREQVRNSPPYDPSRTLTRQHESDLLAHYGYPMYWAGPFLWGPVPMATTGAAAAGPRDAVRTEGNAATREASERVSGLADSQAVIGTHLHATDGDIGHIDDFLAEDDTWSIRYLIVDTSNWWLGRHVLISPSWIERFDWAGHRLEMAVDRMSIKNAPGYDTVPPSRDDEEALHRHYGRPPYWG
jgi:hypothetical protein